jgi:hypothetical protein
MLSSDTIYSHFVSQLEHDIPPVFAQYKKIYMEAVANKNSETFAQNLMKAIKEENVP